MPLVEVGEYILAYLFEIGPVQNNGMGLSPISNMEIEAWQSNTGIELESWECRFLRRLSLEYIQSADQAKKLDCPAPWANAPYVKSAPHATALRMRAEMRCMAGL